MKRILVTPRSVTKQGHPALKRLDASGFQVVMTTPGALPEETELLALLPGCIGYLAGVEKISARVLEAAPGLRAIARNGVGVDNVDLAAAARLGIQVLPAAGSNARGVAELTVAFLLALARAVPFSDAQLKAGRWERRQGIELQGRTLGLVGCGNIGRMVARMARGLDMRVLAYDPCAASIACADVAFCTLEELVRETDAVSLHCSAEPGARPLVDAAFLQKMKPGALLVNTARAGLVDAAAVRAALDSCRLAGFATDVFGQEPPGDDPLVKHSRVIATPHIGGFTAESVNRAIGAAVDNLLGVFGNARDVLSGKGVMG